MGSDRLVVVTPWYPTPSAPYAGSFVRDSVLSLAEHEPVTVVHVENVAPDRVGPPTRTERDGVEVVHVPVATGPLTARADMARNQLAALRAAEVPELAAPGRVQAHVTMPTGWAVAELVPATTRLLVTEHSSTVGKLMRDPLTRAMYVRTLARADAVTVVSEFLARALRAAAPEHAPRILTVPNAVDVARIPMVARPQPGLRRWLYVGNLLVAKGVLDLVDAFAERVARDGGERCTLTLVGEGPDRAAVHERARAAGVLDQVLMVGAVPPQEVPDRLADADVLVHLSRYETFGLSVLEAVAAGVCVVSSSSGGPVETLAAASELGRVELLEAPGPVEVVDAVERLSRRLGTSDAVTAREQLGSRYSREVVTATTRRLLDGATPVEVVTAAPVLRVLAFSLDRATRAEVTASLTAVADHGGTATVISDDVQGFGTLGPAVQVLDAAPLDRPFLPHLVADRVETLPVQVLGLVHRVSSAASRRLPGAAGAGARHVAVATQRSQRRLVKRGPRLSGTTAQHLRPWLLAREARQRGLLPLEVDLVLAPGWRGAPLAWRTALRHGGALGVRRSLTRRDMAREQLAHLARTRDHHGRPGHHHRAGARATAGVERP